MEQEVRKSVKRTTNKTIGSLMVYLVVMYGVVTLYTMIAQLFFMLSGTDQTSQEIYETLVNHLSNSGLSMILGVMIGFLILWAVMHRRVSWKALFVKTEKPMTAKSFLMLLCVFISGQVLFSFVSAGMEAVANLLGYSLMAQIESATTVAETVSMFIYISFVAPVFEELIFRGFVLRGMQPLGRKAAVVIAAIVFGFYHVNLPQAMFAIYIGIVLGYVATNYSIWWAIAMHIINNLYAEVTGILGQNPAFQIIQGLSSYVFLIGFVVGIVVVIQKREEIKEYLHQERIERGYLKCAFTSWTMILLMILCVLMTIPMITKL